MQVFIVGTPFVTAMYLDNKRLNKQIIECNQILDALYGRKTGWKNHPCTIQYKGHEKWLEHYVSCLTLYKHGAVVHAQICSQLADLSKPDFHTQEYFNNMMRRLYTKDHNHYRQWSELGESYENWYWVDNKWKIYKQKQ